MPEIKNQFTGGKMNKDLDERLVPNGEYRDAMNIQVSTSEESDVGTVQNILGNKKIEIQTKAGLYQMNPQAKVVATISDEKVDTIYWLVWQPDYDIILQYTRQAATPVFVFVDDKSVSGGILNFDPENLITGINVVDLSLIHI